eukprot:TRINITY_DN3796_c0_g1_i7.p2 TRINITY_DN3796_c0_g1~~TRINITY_DN3796_c0_g1_i7.p2  ORF type:complete len:141 (+),score=33.29 TRINITY_DN3796_c0_g1_i7:586-1008(+)
MRMMVNNQQFSDITFVVGGQRVFAHKNILSCRSEHFCALISNSMKESFMEAIEMVDVDFQVFLLVMEFIYTDTVVIEPEFAVETLIIGDRYLLHGLKDQAEKVILKEVNIENAASLLDIGKLYGSPLLALKCEQIIERNK